MWAIKRKIKPNQLGAFDADPAMSEQAKTDIDTISTANLKLREELLAQLDTQGESVFISCIDQLMQAKDATRAIALLQLFGNDKAYEIYKKLNLGYQTLILGSLKKVDYRISDAKLMSEMGLYLQNRLEVAQGWRHLKEGLDPCVGQLVLGLHRRDSLQISKAMAGDTLIRFLVYLDPNHLADLLNECSYNEPAHFTQLSSALVRLPEAKKLQAHDVDILAVIQNHLIQQASNEENLSFLRYLQAVLEKSEQRLADELVEFVHKEHPQLGLALVKKTCHFRNFLSLEAPMQQRVLAKLSRRELGYLLVGLQPDFRHVLEQNLQKSLMPTVRAELLSALSLSNEELVSRHKSAMLSLQQQMHAFSGA